ncbi:MAG TPA: cytidine deaminase [Crocinitomicaceae bacterium]|nr:cytidine deaminase [Crocinitomicaceae bacterium]
MKKSIVIDYHEYTSIAELDKSDQELIKQAQKALRNAYAPYSKFHVGAAVQLENGTIITGNNQENIAYPSGLCAERVALFHVGANFPTEKIETLAIAAEGDLIDKNAVISPCGACRQVLFESEKRQQKNIRILIIGMNGKIIAFEKSTDLLTFAFGL